MGVRGLRLFQIPARDGVFPARQDALAARP
jgi:hypothetical protein